MSEIALSALESPIWGQQPNEPHDWHTRFQSYKLLGPSRSVLAAYNSDRERRGLGKSKSAPSNWRDTARFWHWDARAAAWDTRNNDKANRRYEMEHRHWQKRKLEVRDRDWEMSGVLIEKAQQMLDTPLHRVAFKTSVAEIANLGLWELKALANAFGASNLKKTDADALREMVWEMLEKEFPGARRAENLIIIEPGRWSMRDAPAYLEVAQKLAETAIDPNSRRQMDELEAVKLLIEAGWLPEKLLSVVAEQTDEARAVIKAAFQTGDLTSLAIEDIQVAGGDG